MDNDINLTVCIDKVAASGGYMLMCSGDELLANKSSIVGSIGVISASFGFKDLIEKIGVQRRVFTAGENKSFLDPFLEVKEKDVEKLIKVQKSIFENFKALSLIDYSELKPSNCRWADVDKKMGSSKGHNIPQSICFTNFIKDKNYLLNFLNEIF